MELSVQRGLGATSRERSGTAGNAIAGTDGEGPRLPARRG